MPLLDGRPASTSSASARCPLHVGQPTWSVTTSTASRSAPSDSIVSTKLRPPAPNSHEVRTTTWPGAGRGTASSPASFERP